VTRSIRKQRAAEVARDICDAMEAPFQPGDLVESSHYTSKLLRVVRCVRAQTYDVNTNVIDTWQVVVHARGTRRADDTYPEYRLAANRLRLSTRKWSSG